MAEPLRDPKKLQQQVQSFQRVQRQASLLASQRQQMLMQIEELKMAREYLKDSREGAQIYKAVGNLLVETDKKGASKELARRIESFEAREKAIKKQEEGIRARVESMRSELEKAAAA